MATIGEKAPVFALMDKNGKLVSLSDFAGQAVVVYFYPKDNTAGCTLQANTFKEYYSLIKKTGAEVIGISKDSTASHEKFAAKNDLPFILLSDPDQKIAAAYGVLKEKKLYGRNYLGVERQTFIVDEKGYIEQVMTKVKPAENAVDVLAYLEERRNINE